MNGFIISYKPSLKSKDITIINYFLFGRIVKKKKGIQTIYYYYPGLFENTPYIKLTNGCYYTQKIIDDFKGLLYIIQVQDITFPKEVNFTTAREHWKKYEREHNIQIKNL